jgi:hypothetical protein
MDFDEYDRGERAWYDTAQVCLNGHIINSSYKAYPQHNKKFCDKCGAETITKCPNCQNDIRGYYHATGVISFADDTPPAFCPNCGQAYPWTESGLQAAKDLASELEGLTEEERQILVKSLDDLVKDSPQTTVAATRFKKIVHKVTREGASAFREILVNIVTEAARKSLWPSQ